MKTTLGVGIAVACCYRMAAPRPVECRHVCTKCGTVTRTGRIAAATDEFAAGDAVNILHQQGTFAVVVPQKRGLWVSAKFVDREKSCVTADSVRVRMLPTTNGRIVAQLNRGHKVEILPAEAGDPVDWVRLKHAAYGLEDRGVLVEMKNLKDLTYGDGDFALDTRIEDVAWVINGKRTLARRTDVELLKTFLSGRLILKEGRIDEEIPLKRRLARLRELLGEPKK